ncbi:MAG: UDP-N-acetylglucosamine 1-carboxyvinyltransferase [Clostridia bacterium]|nr:UDP-N-acetylglucosamine 1-carboxyvinyltransferase [Clostridia bacterium]
MKYVIKGGRELGGTVRVQGAKNSVLPILAASILANDKCEILDCPSLSDVKTTIDILKALGAKATYALGSVIVDPTDAFNNEIPECLMRKLRSSIVFLGAVTMRMGKARLSMPGGCLLGARPIDLHLKALKALGIKVKEEAGFIETDASEAKSAHVHLAFPSVGATENTILAAVKIKGETLITNAAREPEIIDLISFLNAMGARITGGGTGTIHIEGVASLRGISYRIIPDRIAATTYMCMAMATGGEIELENVRREHLSAITEELREEGARIEYFGERGYIRAPRRIKSADMIKTMPYPGFPTDAQSLFFPHLIKGDSTSVIVENIFENRFKIVEELTKMGADIVTEGRSAIIRGPRTLSGAHVYVPDLRSGAALLIAALSAQGESIVEDEGHIERGYERIFENITALGGDIRINNTADY